MHQKISLTNYSLPVSIGIHNWEKKQLQKLRFDLDLWVDVSEAMISDELSQTIDYTEIADLIKEISAKKHYSLIEHLAYQILDSFSSQLYLYRAVLKITKPQVVEQLESVSFEVEKLYRVSMED
jgi:7,8-dihydroneopterin aldolase/epimerase/oxygenase